MEPLLAAEGNYTLDDYDSLGGVRDDIARSLVLDDGDIVLDVGSGSGNFAFALARTAEVHVFGIDIVACNLPCASARAAESGLGGRCTFRCADLHAMPEAAAGFDVVTSFLALCELLKRSSLEDVLRAMVRRARPGGRLVLVEQFVEDAANERQRLGLSLNAALGYRYTTLEELFSATASVGLVVEATRALATGRRPLDPAGTRAYLEAEARFNRIDGTPCAGAEAIWAAHADRVQALAGSEIDAVLRVIELRVPESPPPAVTGTRAIDPAAQNRIAWNAIEEGATEWTRPVSEEAVAAARRGGWAVTLLACELAPRRWFPRDLAGVKILCLGAGGGQQGPLLAAAGARVTVLDISERQLERDRRVARRDGLELDVVLGDMRDLSCFADETFDVVFNPPSTLFVPDVEVVWRECHRVLLDEGVLIAGFLNPDLFVFDDIAHDGEAPLVVRHAIPCAVPPSSPLAPVEFSHTLGSLIGGQLRAGFAVTDLVEAPHQSSVTRAWMPGYFGTRSEKQKPALWDRLVRLAG